METTRLTKDLICVKGLKCKARVYVGKIYDEGNLINGYKIIVLDEDFNASEIKKFKRNDDAIDATKYLANVADLTMDDANKVGKYILNNLDSIEAVHINSKLNIREVFKVLYSKIKGVELKDGYFILENRMFNEIAESCGWKPLEVKKILLGAKMLNTNNGRRYDFSKKIDNKNVWCISINEQALKEEAMEV